jgi:hypothetical protein
MVAKFLLRLCCALPGLVLKMYAIGYPYFALTRLKAAYTMEQNQKGATHIMR